jgi:hypothetical protein
MSTAQPAGSVLVLQDPSGEVRVLTGGVLCDPLDRKERTPPIWARTLLVDDRGVAYVPFFGGRADVAVRLAARDGVALILGPEGHAYAPSGWLARVDPDRADLYARALACALKYFPDLRGLS